MNLTPLLGQPSPWRIGELASLKIAMICLGIIVALGSSISFWHEYYWLVWLVFVLAMIAPASKLIHLFVIEEKKQRRTQSKRK